MVWFFPVAISHLPLINPPRSLIKTPSSSTGIFPYHMLHRTGLRLRDWCVQPGSDCPKQLSAKYPLIPTFVSKPRVAMLSTGCGSW